MFSKEQILAEIRRTAEENRGVPLGIARFQSATGITRSDWHAKHWTRWGDALAEAGFQPIALQGPRSQEDILGRLADFIRELGRFPTMAEIRLKARSEAGFPWHNTLVKIGGKRALLARLHSFCSERGQTDVATICAQVLGSLPAVPPAVANDPHSAGEGVAGHVYLLKSGRFYKIGRTNAMGRRGRELAIELPEATAVVHSINTDDPIGIEKYWHSRFADRRKNGEWFELTTKDVAAFRRRKFM